MYEKKCEKKERKKIWISHRKKKRYVMTIIANVLYYYMWRWRKKILWYVVSQCAKYEEYYYGESMYRHVKVWRGEDCNYNHFWVCGLFGD